MKKPRLTPASKACDVLREPRRRVLDVVAVVAQATRHSDHLLVVPPFAGVQLVKESVQIPLLLGPYPAAMTKRSRTSFQTVPAKKSRLCSKTIWKSALEVE